MRAFTLVLLIFSCLSVFAADECRPSMVTALARAKIICGRWDADCPKVIDTAAIVIHEAKLTDVQEIINEVDRRYNGYGTIVKYGAQTPTLKLMTELGMLERK